MSYFISISPYFTFQGCGEVGFKNKPSIVGGSGARMDPQIPSVKHLSISQLLQLARLVLARVQALRDIELDELTANSNNQPDTASAAGSWVPVDQTPIPVWTCPYSCQFCGRWCTRLDDGHRHHRCRQHRRQ